MRIRILDSGKLLHVESGILDFGIWNTAQRIRNPTNDYNPESKYHWQRIRNPVPRLRIPRLSCQIPLHVTRDRIYTGAESLLAPILKAYV